METAAVVVRILLVVEALHILQLITKVTLTIIDEDCKRDINMKAMNLVILFIQLVLEQEALVLLEVLDMIQQLVIFTVPKFVLVAQVRLL